MRHLPRALNRIGLFLGGLILTAAGVGLVLVAAWPKAHQHFAAGMKTATDRYTDLVNKSYVNVGGIQEFSWMTIAWVALAIIVALLMLAWIFSQGGGKRKEFRVMDADGPEGRTVPQVSFVDDLLTDAIEDDKWVASTKTSAWDVKGEPGLAIDVNSYKGADLAHLETLMRRAIAQLDSVMGKTVPVRIHFTSNLRTRFGSADRVE